MKRNDIFPFECNIIQLNNAKKQRYGKTCDKPHDLATLWNFTSNTQIPFIIVSRNSSNNFRFRLIMLTLMLFSEKMTRTYLLFYFEILQR